MEDHNKIKNTLNHTSTLLFILCFPLSNNCSISSSTPMKYIIIEVNKPTMISINDAKIVMVVIIGLRV